MSETRRLIIEAIREAGPLQPKAIADALELPRDLVRQTVTRMAKDDQLINTVGTYSIPPVPPSQVSQVSLEEVSQEPPPSPVTVTGVTDVTGVQTPSEVNEW